MGGFIYFSHENLLSSDDGKTRHLTAEVITQLVAVLLNFSRRRRFYLRGLVFRYILSRLDDLVCPLLRLSNELLRFVLAFAD